MKENVIREFRISVSGLFTTQQSLNQMILIIFFFIVLSIGKNLRNVIETEAKPQVLYFIQIFNCVEFILILIQTFDPWSDFKFLIHFWKLIAFSLCCPVKTSDF